MWVLRGNSGTVSLRHGGSVVLAAGVTEIYTYDDTVKNDLITAGFVLVSDTAAPTNTPAAFVKTDNDLPFVTPQSISAVLPSGGSPTTPVLALYQDAVDAGHVSHAELVVGGQSDGGPDIPMFKLMGVWTVPTDGIEAASLKFFVNDGGAYDGNPVLELQGQKIGFYGKSPASKTAVTGSRAGNAALQSLLTALAGLGLITDSST